MQYLAILIEESEKQSKPWCFFLSILVQEGNAVAE
jgi:hypothetical protein